MDIVVTTPHGDADIDIVAAGTDTTLADLLQAITGQAPPATARVDGRTVSSAHALSDLELAVGTVVDTRPDLGGRGQQRGAMGLLQLTGRGAGTVTTLAPGRYRIGPARGVRTPELAMAPVETAAFEITVDQSEPTVITPGELLADADGYDAATVDGQQFDREMKWHGGTLRVAGRHFEFERPAVAPARRRLQPPAPDGSIPFRRRTTAPTSIRPLVVGARRDAAAGGGQLWQWRPGDRGAFEVRYGIGADDTEASVDFLRNVGVALVGSDDLTTSLARTLLVELCTMHAPSTLDVVIASSTDEAVRWDWSRWLPHVRGGRPDAPPQIMADLTSLAAWAERFAKRPTPATSPLRLTLLILDDASLWDRRDSPVHPLLTNPPDDLRVLALGRSQDRVPAVCSTFVEESGPSGASVAHHTGSPNAGSTTTGITPALVDESLALEIARHLAPLDDLDTDGTTLPSTEITPPTLPELIDISAGLASDRPRLAIAVGVADGISEAPSGRRSVQLELSGPLSTIVTAADPSHHDRITAAIILGAAAQRRPDELAIVIIGRERHPWHDQLRHVAGWAGRDEAEDPARLVDRIAQVVSERPELHVLIVIEHAYDRHDPLRPDLIAAVNELAVTFLNVHVVLTGDHPASVSAEGRSNCGALAWFTADGEGTVWFPDRSLSFVGLPAAPPDRDEPASAALRAGSLVVRPAAHTRAMTPLERRLERHGQSEVAVGASDSTIAAIVAQINGRAGSAARQRSRPPLLPPPLPFDVDARTLFAKHPGDAVPLGLVDRPELAGHDVFWWQPGPDGSVLAVGSPRSEMTAVVDLIVLGVALRFSADDLHVYAIEPAGRRRRAVEALPHTGRVVDADRGDMAGELIAGLRSMLSDRLENPTRLDRPDIVLLIADLGRVRRSLAATAVASTFEQLEELVVSGPWVGINVVLAAERVDDLGSLDRLVAHRLVGPLSDPDDRSRLGVAAVDAADRHPRRCWSTSARRRVQIARPPDAIDDEIEAVSPEPAVRRPPRIIAPEGRAQAT